MVFWVDRGFWVRFSLFGGYMWFFLADSLLVPLGLSLSLLVPSLLINSFVGLYASCFFCGPWVAQAVFWGAQEF